MEILKIDNGSGYYYSFKSKSYVEINFIDRDSLLAIIEYIMSNDDCTKDDYKEELINNKAQRIIYKDLDEKIGDLLKNKQAIIKEVDSKYNEAFEKYKKEKNEDCENYGSN